ncbi:MAG: hypothetical protein QY312_02485 [Candidatus Dojkabacteria bacterium]|nr:MAG: hypothetical protein QY312_02485 [Candidatus Dojkabacteria bacterium]
MDATDQRPLREELTSTPLQILLLDAVDTNTGTPYNKAYARYMLEVAQAQARALAKPDPDDEYEEPADEEPDKETEGENPVHHSGNPKGYPDGTANDGT